MTFNPCPRWLVIGAALIPWVMALVALVLLLVACDAANVFPHGGVLVLKSGERVACARISYNSFAPYGIRCDQDNGYMKFRERDILTMKIPTIDRAARP